MAILKLTTSVKANWTKQDQLRLYVGDENVAKLANAQPAGGALVKETPAKVSQNQSNRTVDARYGPDDKCALLAYGLSVIDPAGNETSVYETFDGLADLPIGVQAGVPQATGNAGEATLSWQQSEDV